MSEAAGPPPDEPAEGDSASKEDGPGSPAGAAPGSGREGPGREGLGREGLARLLWEHSGRLAAGALVALFMLVLLFLAVVGSTAALTLLIVIVVGLAMIALGGRIHA